eukprot:12648042-Alexandrium_andersonii.AAC.1
MQARKVSYIVAVNLSASCPVCSASRIMSWTSLSMRISQMPRLLLLPCGVPGGWRRIILQFAVH